MLTFDRYQRMERKKAGRDFNETQWNSKYKRYCASEEKRRAREQRYAENARKKTHEYDKRWKALRESRDTSFCTLLVKLQQEKRFSDIMYIKDVGGGFHKTIDLAHVIARSESPDMKYDNDNIIPLNRYSHRNLDTYRDPIYGTPITSGEVEKWWRYLVGDGKYDELKERSRRKHGQFEGAESAN